MEHEQTLVMAGELGFLQSNNNNKVEVISHQFCAPYVVDLVIARKLLTPRDCSFLVSDVNGNAIFKVKGSFFSIRDRCVILDTAGIPIVSLRQKILTAHRRWQVFRGDNTDPSDLIFSAKKSSLIQAKTELDVFLAGNTKEDVCDFKVRGSWLERSCTIYVGNSSTIIAQMHRKHNLQSIVLGKDMFSMSVYPNVDYAFIVALAIILEEINEDRSGDD